MGLTRSDAKVRVLGLGIEDFRAVSGRNSGLFRALDDRLDVVGAVEPALPGWRLRSIQALHFAPERYRWRRRAGLSPMMFTAMSGAAERALAAREGQFDVIVQQYCVFAPGRLDRHRRYACYLDTTARSTRRQSAAQIPVSDRAFERWCALEQRVYEGAARLFAMSDWCKGSLVADYGIDPARIVVAGAGTNLLEVDLDGRRWDQRVAVFVGLDWGPKGGPVLLEAWREVRRALPDAELWIVGTRRDPAPGADGVRWFGRVKPSVVGDLYTRATAFVLPSLFDAFPHAVREAMGRGLPCVATATGGTPEIFRTGQEGMLVAPGDPGALADALIALLSDPSRAETMGRAGHTRTVREVTWEVVADRIAPHLESMARE